MSSDQEHQPIRSSSSNSLGASNNRGTDGSSSVSVSNEGEEDEHQEAANFTEEVKTMTGLQMLARQLRIFSVIKNLDPSWKSLAKETVHPFVIGLYVASSFVYTTAGVVLLVQASHLRNVINPKAFPWYVYGSYLVLQGIITHLSDVVYVDQRSIWHPTDRCFALTGIAFSLAALGACFSTKSVRQNDPGLLVLVVMGTILSGVLFAVEWKCKVAENITAFMLCHAGWHFFGPAALILFVLLI